MDTFEQINDKMHLLLTELSNKPMYKRGEIGV
jgi:hypothetical protein